MEIISGCFWPSADGAASRSRGTLRSTSCSDGDVGWALELDVPSSRAAAGPGDGLAVREAESPTATWYGVLGDASPATLVGVTHARSPRAVVQHVVIGAHLRTEETEVTAVRWLVAGASLQAGQESPTSLGRLSTWQPDQTRPVGLQLDLTDPVTFTGARVLAAEITRLWDVAAGLSTQIAQLSVQIGGRGRGAWIRQVDAQRVPLHERNGDFFHAHELDFDEVARWADRCHPWGKVTAMTLPQPVPIEVQVLIYGSALEGLHRRTFGRDAEQAIKARRLRDQARPTRLEDVTRPVLSRAVTAAVDAGIQYLDDQGVGQDSITVLRRRMREALNHVDEPSYRERLREVLDPVAELVPDLFDEDLDHWAGFMAALRNGQAHSLPQSTHGSVPNHDSFREVEQVLYLRWAETARWALRLALLLPALDPDKLRERVTSPKAPFQQDLLRLRQWGLYRTSE